MTMIDRVFTELEIPPISLRTALVEHWHFKGGLPYMDYSLLRAKLTLKEGKPDTFVNL